MSNRTVTILITALALALDSAPGRTQDVSLAGINGETAVGSDPLARRPPATPGPVGSRVSTSIGRPTDSGPNHPRHVPGLKQELNSFLGWFISAVQQGANPQVANQQLLNHPAYQNYKLLRDKGFLIYPNMEAAASAFAAQYQAACLAPASSVNRSIAMFLYQEAWKDMVSLADQPYNNRYPTALQGYQFWNDRSQRSNPGSILRVTAESIRSIYLREIDSLRSGRGIPVRRAA